MKKLKLEGQAYITYQWKLGTSHSKYFEVVYYSGKERSTQWGSTQQRITFLVCEGMICTLRFIQGVGVNGEFTTQEYQDAFLYGMAAYVYSQRNGNKHYHGHKNSRAYMSTHIEDDYRGKIKEFLDANGFYSQGHYEVETDCDDNESSRYILVRNDDENFNIKINEQLDKWRKTLSD